DVAAASAAWSIRGEGDQVAVGAQRRLDIRMWGVQFRQIEELAVLAIIKVDVGEALAALAVGGEGQPMAVAAQRRQAVLRSLAVQTRQVEHLLRRAVVEGNVPALPADARPIPRREDDEVAVGRQGWPHLGV